MVSINNNCDGRLASKVAIVTGAASGIGRAVAELAAAQGALVALLDYDGDAAHAIAGAMGGSAIALRVDVSKAAEVDAAVDEVVARFGRIDILANVAGVHDLLQPVEEFDETVWNRVFAINVLGTALMTRRVLRDMLSAGAGAIVNVASTSAYKGAMGGTAYSASKGAIVSMTSQVAHDVASRGVRVNAVAAGPAASNILQTANTIIGERTLGPMNQHFFDKVVGKGVSGVPMGRFGDPIEIAQGILFLASDEASYITGTTLAVDGGLLIA